MIPDWVFAAELEVKFLSLLFQGSSLLLPSVLVVIYYFYIFK